MSTYKADVIVIGAGVVGCSASYYLAKQGCKVICLEKTMIGHGASSRNGAFARLSGRDPRDTELAIYGAENIWPTLSEELGTDVEWKQRGYLVCGYNDAHKKNILERIKGAKKFGLEAILYEGDIIRKINPYLSDRITCAAWTPKDAVVNPLTTTLGYYKRARQLGAKFMTGTAVVKLATKQGRIRQVVVENGDIYEADAVILAAGYFSRKIYNTLGLDIPIYKRLVEVIVTEAAPHMFDMMIGGMSGFYGHQTQNGSFLFGNNTGREHCFAEMSFGDNPISTSHNVSNIARTVVEDFPEISRYKIIRHWSGWNDNTPDGAPVMGAVDEIPGLYISFGSCGHGFSTGPAVGFTLSEMVLGRPAPVDISGLRYDRFDYALNSSTQNIDDK